MQTAREKTRKGRETNTDEMQTVREVSERQK